MRALELMTLSEVYNFYQKMEDENIILSFKGEFTSDLLTSILHIMEAKMHSLGITPRRKKRVFNVLVECFQNLYHHIEEHTESEGEIVFQKSALIMVMSDGDKITVRTGNYIRNEGIDDLEKRIEMINSLSDEQLRELYQKRLSDSELSIKGTAGLGLIDIARKSKSKLDYEFINVDNSCSFFA